MFFEARLVPRILEDFHDYSPPVDVSPVIRRLLRSVKRDYLVRLEQIVLTTSDHKPQFQPAKSRGHKRVAANLDETGNYRGGQIWLFVDTILANIPHGKSRDRNTVEHVFAKALFRQIGRHIQSTTAPERGNREQNSNQSEMWLYLSYMARKYWYTVPLIVCMVAALMFRNVVVMVVRGMLQRLGVPLKPLPAPV